MNHSKVIIRQVHRRHILIETLRGERLPLPRILFRWSIGRGASVMVRRQFPLRPGYASTYNGAQGETLTRCVADTRQDPFAHGHLYVAMGRVQHRQDLRILSTASRLDSSGCALTKNIVWKELLLPEGDAAAHSTRPVLKRPASAPAPSPRRRKH